MIGNYYLCLFIAVMKANIRGVDSKVRDNMQEYRTLKNEIEDNYRQAKLIQKNIDRLS